MRGSQYVNGALQCSKIQWCSLLVTVVQRANLKRGTVSTYHALDEVVVLIFEEPIRPKRSSPRLFCVKGV